MAKSETIAAVVYDLRASGVVRNLLRIARALRDAGLDCEIWPLRAQGEFLETATRIAPVKPVLKGTTGRQRDWDSALAIAQLRRTIRARRPAIVLSAGNQMHVHAALALRGLAAADRPRFVGRASNAVAFARLSPLAAGAVGTVERFQYRAMDHVIAVSQELGAQLVDRVGLPGDRVTVIPNGVEIESFAPPYGPAPDASEFGGGRKPVVLGIGRLSYQKDFATLIRAFSRLPQRHGARLAILGRGSGSARRRLEQLAAKLGVADRVELAGHVDDVRARLAQADLFVSSSRWEGSSNAVLEALASGTQVVATRAPTGIVEVLAPLGEDRLVPVGDAHALARAMERALDRPRPAGAMIDRARAYQLSHTLDLYCRVMTEQLRRARGS